MHSLSCFQNGKYYGKLYDLYDAGELTNAIHRIIEDMSHHFLKEVLIRDFVSSDLDVSARNLRNERDPQKRSAVLDNIDREAVNKRMMKLLDIQNKRQQSVEILPEHLAQIRIFLKAMDLIVECPIRNGETGLGTQERVLFTQPGMRYCQSQALVHSLMKDETFTLLSRAPSVPPADWIKHDILY